MNANQKRALKGKVYDGLVKAGFSVSMTDTPNLSFFTDRPINNRSRFIGNYNHSFLTTLYLNETERYLV